MRKGELWVCMSPLCGCEIEIVASSNLENQNPRCLCGGEMRKPYIKPMLRLLSAEEVARRFPLPSLNSSKGGK